MKSENQKKIFDSSPNDSNIFKLDSFENLLLKEYDDFMLTKKDLICVPALDKLKSDLINKFLRLIKSKFMIINNKIISESSKPYTIAEGWY